MQLTARTIISYLEELAPQALALPDDRIGLQVGNPDSEINRLVVALDPDQDALEKAIEIEAGMLVTHHPMIYRPLTAIDESKPSGRLIATAIRAGLVIYCAHTNYDIAPDGVSFQLAEALGLPLQEAKVLEVTGEEELFKLVVYVPRGHEDQIRQALSAAGAGQIGRYSHCTFQVAGTGTFLPEEGTSPYIGSSGRLEKVDEFRLETILPAAAREAVLEALHSSHPYEEVAYDLYPLRLEGKKWGLGLVIDLSEPKSMEEIISSCREGLKAPLVRFHAAGNKEFRRIAICGGSGGSLIKDAVNAGAELYISGDFRYHDLQQAAACGLALVDAGHDVTEMPAVLYLQKHLERKLKQDSHPAEVICLTQRGPNWKVSKE